MLKSQFQRGNPRMCSMKPTLIGYPWRRINHCPVGRAVCRFPGCGCFPLELFLFPPPRPFCRLPPPPPLDSPWVIEIAAFNASSSSLLILSSSAAHHFRNSSSAALACSSSWISFNDCFCFPLGCFSSSCSDWIATKDVTRLWGGLPSEGGVFAHGLLPLLEA